MEGVGEGVGGGGEGVLGIAPGEDVGLGVELTGFDGGFDADDRCTGLVGGLDCFCREAGGFWGVGDDGGDHLAVELDEVGGEEGLVVAGGAGVVEAGDIFGGEDGVDSGGGAGVFGIEGGELGVGVGGADGMGVEGARAECGVVHVEGGSGDVAGGGFVVRDSGWVGRGGDVGGDGIGVAGEVFAEEIADERWCGIRWRRGDR